jgi:hypothetical protein
MTTFTVTLSNCRGLDWPHSGFGRGGEEKKFLHRPELKSRSSIPQVSHCTDWATLDHYYKGVRNVVCVRFKSNFKCLIRTLPLIRPHCTAASRSDFHCSVKLCLQYFEMRNIKGTIHFQYFNIVLTYRYVDKSSSSLKVRDQVSHPYSTTGKITVLYILIFSFFLVWDGMTKDFGLNDSKHSPNLI